jgi:hypothetical protein
LAGLGVVDGGDVWKMADVVVAHIEMSIAQVHYSY